MDWYVFWEDHDLNIEEENGDFTSQCLSWLLPILPTYGTNGVILLLIFSVQQLVALVRQKADDLSTNNNLA